MKARSRSGAPVLACLFAFSATPFADAAQPRDPVTPSPAVEVRDTLAALGLPIPSPRAVVRTVNRLAVAVERAQTPRFPVDGPFNWGQGEAAYGSARSGHVHEGQDLFGRTGTPLDAVSDGVVVKTGDDGGRGNYVAIHDPEAGRTYVYLHMAGPSPVARGERVSAGRRVGALGCTGSCSGDHLHFEIRRGRGTTGASLDPLPHLRRWADVHDARATLAPGEH
ncbi:hypothetical protein BH20ACT20_BH20ACT20_08060 [soil metagenome]